MTEEHRTNRQYAPWPAELEVLVAMVRYRPGWRFRLEDTLRDPADTHGAAAGGLTLVITTLTSNSRHQVECETCRSPVLDYSVHFAYPVPPATYDRATWLEWLMDRVEETELHESREFFRLEHIEIDSHANAETPFVPAERHVVEHPFAPNHGPGRDPGRRYAYAPEEASRTSYRGVVAKQ